MATSSIFKDFTIEGPVEVGNFVKMLDSEPMPIPDMSDCIIDDPEEGWRIMEAAAKNMKARAEARRKAAEERESENGSN